MKVESTLGSGSRTALTVLTGIVVVIAMLAGAGFVPVSEALATVHAPGRTGEDSSEALTLPLADGQKSADSIRQPSDLGVVDAQLAGTRTPTTVRRVTRTAAAPTGSAPAAAPVSGDGWRSAKVSWYGPGFIGNTMAGGGTLEWGSMVVAHKSLPFGTMIEFEYNGRTCVAVVQDRGPYAGGRTFDLGPGTAAALGFSGVGTVQYRIL
ncbi:MAG: septal ring lytic transglycosylase RlpA family protein [Coriobacteriia bacterium]|nr:septal ring lytic transglycosylase RlpA family protein [Coriobacteriia bacterium]